MPPPEERWARAIEAIAEVVVLIEVGQARMARGGYEGS